MTRFFYPVRLLLAALAVLGLLMAAFTTAPTAMAAQASPKVVPNEYIVVLKDSLFSLESSLETDLEDLSLSFGLTRHFTYRSIFKGFAAHVPADQLEALKRHPRVSYVVADEVVTLGDLGFTAQESGDGFSAQAQTIPTGIRRIGGTVSSQAAGNGSGAVSNVAVAVLDTGVQGNHPDLNVVGGYNCISANRNDWGDGNGHGTHVAGTIGAKDNDAGVVGVAPGVPIYAVRILNSSGSGTSSSAICGMDWVATNAKAKNIKVANMSLGGPGADDGNCGRTRRDPRHTAACRLVANGVTLVVAAGNSSANSARFAPASYDEAITVSALADFDGLPGGKGQATCRRGQDDTFASFSNYGADVDIIAPGVCIVSTYLGGRYAIASGTSMASPHVAGAAALYLSRNPGASPARVKDALLSNANFNWNNSDDPDGIKEPLLDVSKL